MTGFRFNTKSKTHKNVKLDFDLKHHYIGVVIYQKKHPFLHKGLKYKLYQRYIQTELN